MDNAKGWLQYLSDEDAIFIKNFMLSSGSLKEMSKLYRISYPTLRRRLDQLINKIHMYRRRRTLQSSPRGNHALG